MAIYKINDSADDGSWYLPSTFLTTGYLFIGYSTYARNGFLRFTDVQIIKASIINSAVLTLTAAAADSGTCIVRIRSNNVDDAVAPTSYNEATSLTETTAYSDWEIPNTTSGVSYSSSSLISIIQEIIDRGGWTSGNDLMLIIRNQSGTSRRRFHDRSGSSTLQASLEITWTEPAGNTFTQKVVMF